ncbi:MAG: glycoside hydrolase family 38 N-terminal domain-containing protein, partial [Pirellulaceae bacterium]
MKPHLLVALAVLVTVAWPTGGRSAPADPASQAAPTLAPESKLRIAQVEPTPLFPQPAAGQPLKQLARLHLDNSGEPVAVVARITVGSQAPDTQDLGPVAQGSSIVNIRIPDIASPTLLTIEVQNQDGTTLASQQLDWQPQKKWSLYCVAYSHHDLGFGNYPHRLRTEIRHANIERPLQYCRDTDSWDEDSKFRFMIETSEPLPSFLGSHTVADAEELARRVREGRIQIGALHNTANTEQLGHELLARLLYLSNRHGRDLLNVPASRTAQIDDVIGLTWPLATFCAEADIPYFFHGPNMCGRCLQPADSEPVFYWQGPDRHGQVLTRSAFYGGYAGDSPGDVSETHLVNCINKLGANWPYATLLLQEGSDFQLVTMDTANRIHTWNAAWAYPHLVCATMDMFFDALAKQADPTQIKTFAKDSNNQWADQDSNDARLLSQARRADELIPTAEKFSTIALATSGGGYPWTDIYQAYHRLLAYHEHTNAIDGIGPNRERMRQYETELEENREMVVEAQEFAGSALTGALNKLGAAIARTTQRTVVVWNPLTRQRTDVVHLADTSIAAGDRLLDVGTDREVPWQKMPDGSVAFVAADVPSLGYRDFAIAAGGTPTATPSVPSLSPTLENRYYRVTFDATTGAITGLFDKELNVELVDQAAPHRFNEYLYERFESSDWDAPRAWQRVGTAQLTTSGGPVADVMSVAAVATGVESLQQTVILYRELKRIDFVLNLLKSPSGRRDTLPPSNPLGKESVYVALPFAVPEHAFRHELPGCVAEPVNDLFDGACTAYYAVRHFSDVSNRRYGVTVSAPDSSLIEYDHPRSCPIRSGGEGLFERTKTLPATSRMYLYLMNNMFDVNVRWDQPGPVRFRYAMRSHAGDWQAGCADEFGWDVMNPLIATVAEGRQPGSLPAAAHSFLSIDCPNVACTTIKPAEANGSGFILRFVETQGRAATANVTLPCLPPLAAATETNLIEDDRPHRLAVGQGNRLAVSLRPFGVMTIRVTCAPRTTTVAQVKAEAVSDMEVALSWQADATQSAALSHYHVYRGTQPDFQPGLLNLAQRPQGPACVDRPQLYYGGWINNRLEPDTTYYYRVAAVDRWNNEGAASAPVAVTTLKATDKNMAPLSVACLRAVLVSPLSRFNVVNLLWRTNCESDVRKYELHRSLATGFTPDSSTCIGLADADAPISGSQAYGHVSVEYRMRDYDHMMYVDEQVQPLTTYYYRVRAVDASGAKGAYSDEVSVTTKAPDPLALLSPGISAQSVYAPEFGVELAIDGSPDPYQAWISQPYGGGT